MGLVLLLSACSSGPRFQKEPIDDLIKEYNTIQNFSIILLDMNYDEDRDKYLHQYQVMYSPLENPDTLLEKTSDWLIVSDEYFEKQVENMGMSIATKVDGTLKKVAAPPGYNYAGDKRYGSWQTNSSGGSFWQFYGQYMFMRSMFGMMSYPVNRSSWNSYDQNYRSGRPYYGSGANGSKTYGTQSKFNQSRSANSSWNKKSGDFKQRVRSKVKQSSAASKRSRTSSRSSRSSTRSRGGGFGK